MKEFLNNLRDKESELLEKYLYKEISKDTLECELDKILEQKMRVMEGWDDGLFT